MNTPAENEAQRAYAQYPTIRSLVQLANHPRHNASIGEIRDALEADKALALANGELSNVKACTDALEDIPKL